MNFHASFAFLAYTEFWRAQFLNNRHSNQTNLVFYNPYAVYKSPLESGGFYVLTTIFVSTLTGWQPGRSVHPQRQQGAQ